MGRNSRLPLVAAKVFRQTLAELCTRPNSELESRTGGVYRVAVEKEAEVIRGDICDYRADECDKAENVSLIILQRKEQET